MSRHALKQLLFITLIITMQGMTSIHADNTKTFDTDEKVAVAISLMKPKPFIGSRDWKYHQDTLFKLIQRPIYTKMVGNEENPIGYLYQDPGVMYHGGPVDVEFIHTELADYDYSIAFARYLAQVAAAEKIKLTTAKKPQRISVKICIVSIETRITRIEVKGKMREIGFPSCVYEMVVRDNEGKRAIYRRIYRGKRDGLKYALMECAAEVVYTLTTMMKPEKNDE